MEPKFNERICNPVSGAELERRWAALRAAETGARANVMALAWRYVRIKQRVVLGRVTMRPAIDDDGPDVTGRIKRGSCQHPSQLVANLALERLERCRQKFRASRAVLVMLGEACLAGGAHHEQQRRFIG